MSDDYYKKIFAKNLKRYMEENGKTQIDIINDLHINKSAISTWCNGTRLPRMDKVDALAKYFHCRRSDLIEEKTELDNDVRMTQCQPKIMDHYSQLNDIGKREATKRVEELTYLEKYVKKDTAYQLNAAHTIEGASKEDRQHDDDIMDDENF